MKKINTTFLVDIWGLSVALKYESLYIQVTRLNPEIGVGRSGDQHTTGKMRSTSVLELSKALLVHR